MIIAVILAAGKGTRIKNAEKPKQYLEIGGKPILVHTVEKFLACNQIDRIVIAVHPDWLAYTNSLFSASEYQKVSVCTGADNRQESLYKALLYCKTELNAPDNTIIVSHDAARPFVTQEIIKANIDAMQSAEVVNTVIPAVDTIIQSADGKTITAATDRSQMYQVQTPQTFKLLQYIEIYSTLDRMALSQVTDAVGIFYTNGIPVKLVAGDRKNLKITVDEDMLLATLLVDKKLG